MGGIAVVLDQDIVPQAVQPADGLGAVPLQVALAENDVRRVDEPLVVDVDVLVFRRNKALRLGPLLLRLEIPLPDVFAHGDGDGVGADEAGEGAVRLVFHQALVHVLAQGVHPARHVHHQLFGQEVQALVKRGVGGLHEVLHPVQVPVHH